MRSAFLPVLLGLFPAVSAIASGCTGSSSAAPPSGDAGMSSSGSGGSSGGSGGSSGGDGGGCTVPTGSGFQYAPAGCCYAYAPNPQSNFMNLALDSSSAAGAPPLRVRLGLGGGVHAGQSGYADPSTTAAFTWETAAANGAAKVRLGTSASSMTMTQTGYTWTSNGLDGTPAYMHEAHVCGLQPDTHYYYQVGGGPSGSEVWSATQDFLTVPAEGNPVTVGVFGDSRDVVGVWELVHARMKEAQVSLMAVPGDVVDTGSFEQEYQNWLDPIWHPNPKDTSQLGTLGQAYILPINGNHENDSPDSFSNWSIPADSTDQYPETYASFNVGPIHFVLIDDQHISAVGGGQTDPEATVQLAWIDSDLKAADADRAHHPFVVALSHRGMYSTSFHAQDNDVLNVREQLAPLYDKYHVDLAVNGHDHEYERSQPLNAGSTPRGAPNVVAAGQGTTYIINAGAGANPYPINSAPASYSAKQVTFCGNGTACAGSPYIGMYSLLDASMTSLKVTVYGLKASSTSMANDGMVDQLTLSPRQ